MIAKRKSANRKPLTHMTADELARVTARFNRPLPDDAGKPMTSRQVAQWKCKGPGRPRKGLGSVNVLISFERGLLERADAYAKRQGVGRSALIAAALEATMDQGRLREAAPKKAG